ncbi:hypothetical protein LDELB18P2_0846 [Lactobacillus delbrueckii]|nr:hypothetical protein LDELB18P2_0846 [Lactobacillus delbrueckii]
MGSPPLAWGIPVIHSFQTVFIGITPTCVGNTVELELDQWHVEDHPHLRGEYLIYVSRETFLVGSPPLAWGIPKVSAKFYNSRGITPTCVGNTQRSSRRLRNVWDHPHLRGEYL